MIIDNGTSFVEEFKLFEIEDTSVCHLRFPKSLLIFGDSGYPASPIGYKEKGIWTEVFLKDELQKEFTTSVHKMILLNHVADRLFSSYRKTLRRCSKDNEAFVRSVIQVTLLSGFNGDVVSITDRDLAYVGLNRAPVKTALRKLHDLGILIHLTGYGLPPTEPRNAIPMGFMASPQIYCLVENTLAKIEGGKMSLADIKDIKIGELNER